MSKHILIVEDHPYDQELALFALKRAGLSNETVIVGDGAEALDYLFRRGAFARRQPGNPAIVILDLKLPKIDGLEVLHTLRDHPDTARIPVVMLTGSSQERDVAASYELGVNAFVVKPIKFDELVDVFSDIGKFWALVNSPPPRSALRQSPVPDAD